MKIFISAVFVATIMYIATSSLAIQCMNTNEGYKEDNMNSFNFLVINLVCAIVMLLSTFGAMYLSFQRIM